MTIECRVIINTECVEYPPRGVECTGPIGRMGEKVAMFYPWSLSTVMSNIIMYVACKILMIDV